MKNYISHETHLVRNLTSIIIGHGRKGILSVHKRLSLTKTTKHDYRGGGAEPTTVAGLLLGHHGVGLLDQFVDHSLVGERRHVAELLGLGFLGDDFPEHAAHDLAAASLREGGRDDHVVWSSEWTDVRAHRFHQRVDEVGRLSHIIHQNSEASDALSFDRMRETNHSSFGDLFASNQSTLDLGAADAVARDVEHIVHTPGHPVVSVLVAVAAIAGEVIPGVG